MSSESSFDIVSQFDVQELKNAVDQVKREVTTRYDFRGLNVEITLTEDDITLVVPDNMKLNAVRDMLFQKLVNRKLSPKILEFKEPEPAAGGALRVVVKLIKALDQETCKKIAQMIRDNFPKVKTNINGSTLRAVGKSRDDLQAVISFLNSKQEELKVPVVFQNYR